MRVYLRCCNIESRFIFYAWNRSLSHFRFFYHLLRTISFVAKICVWLLLFAVHVSFHLFMLVLVDPLYPFKFLYLGIALAKTSLLSLTVPYASRSITIRKTAHESHSIETSKTAEPQQELKAPFDQTPFIFCTFGIEWWFMGSSNAILFSEWKDSEIFWKKIS